MLVKVEVTQEDIDAGVKGQRLSCPIALAALRANLKFEGVSASLTRAFAKEIGYLPLPKQARDFVGLFDSGKEVNPFSFEVEIDD